MYMDSPDRKMEQKIGNSEFTVKWLEEILRKELNTQASIQNLSISAENDFAKGLTSDILVVQLTWDTDWDNLPLSIVLKIPTFKQFKKTFEKLPDDHPLMILINEGDIEKLPVAKFHRCEVTVYDLFIKNPPPHLKIPWSYFGRSMEKHHNGILVLEDLSAGGSTYAQGLNRGQLMQMAESLAALHAYSLTSKDWRHDAIRVTIKSLQIPNIPSSYEMLCGSVAQMKTDFPEIFDPLADKCLELCKSNDDIFDIYKLNEKMGLPDVFCHGDLQTLNIMWMKDKDGKITDELMAVYDWQICHPGNIGEDFARLLTSSVPADIRRNHFMKMLEYYYECLTKFLASKPLYSFDQLLESYKRCFKYGMVMTVRTIMRFVKISSFLGENPEQTTKEILERVKADIEDAVTYEEALDL